MKLKIRSIHGHGKAAEEYVIIDVLHDCMSNRYMIADSTFTSSETISNKTRHTYWFNDISLKRGDVVILYTCNGRDNNSKQGNGSTIYHIYWGLDSAVWNDSGDCAILFEISNWKTTSVSETK